MIGRFGSHSDDPWAGSDVTTHVRRSSFDTRSVFYHWYGDRVKRARQRAQEVDIRVASEVGSGLEPPWWRQPKTRGRRRPPLSRDAIVDAALAILDAEGVDALTIRRLGEKLGTGSASLYWHIAGKDELCELVYDRIMGEIELPALDPARWSDQLKQLARQAYRAMLSHNDAVRLSIGRPPAGPNTLRIVEWMLALMRGAGIPDQPAAQFGNILGRFLDASVLETSMGARASDADASPNVADDDARVLEQPPCRRVPEPPRARRHDVRRRCGRPVRVRPRPAHARPRRVPATRALGSAVIPSRQHRRTTTCALLDGLPRESARFATAHQPAGSSRGEREADGENQQVCNGHGCELPERRRGSSPPMRCTRLQFRARRRAAPRSRRSPR